MGRYHVNEEVQQAAEVCLWEEHFQQREQCTPGPCIYCPASAEYMLDAEGRMRQKEEEGKEVCDHCYEGSKQGALIKPNGTEVF